MSAKKSKTAYVCSECGADYLKWVGQCTNCNGWNTLKEFHPGGGNGAERSWTTGYAGTEPRVEVLSRIKEANHLRITSGMGECDRVLGGGLIPGAVILLAGAPGSGKSTALLQILAHASQQYRTLYVSGEESLEQIAGRARRIGLPMDQLRILSDTSVERIRQTADREQPAMMVIDSIQVMYHEGVDAAPGGVSQVRECTAFLTRYAKANNIVLLLIGHVTKDQNLAGPMTLSHIVDTQIMLSSTDDSRFRIMRATKNRFGAVNEVGLFAMTDKGLREVKNPSAMFLSRSEEPKPGSVVNVLWEGSRPLLVEIQALVVESQYGNARRLGVGVEQNRIAMLLAVLTKHGGISTADQDVFVNCVGGIRVNETSADLAVILGIVSSYRDVVIPHDLFVFGEVGLSGEIRPVPNGESRIQEAGKHGFKKAILPKANLPKRPPAGMEIIGVGTISETLDVL